MSDTDTEKTYHHTPEMGEISGFGGGYEAACQTMLDRGVKWLLARPKAKLEAHGFENVYGIMIPDSADAKELSEVITKDVDCTGAMHQAVMGRLFYIAKNGWESYVSELIKHEAAE